jgi:uncharacterized membrane protein
MKLSIGLVISLLLSYICNTLYHAYPCYLIAFSGGAITVFVCIMWYELYDRVFK